MRASEVQSGRLVTGIVVPVTLCPSVSTSTINLLSARAPAQVWAQIVLYGTLFFGGSRLAAPACCPIEFRVPFGNAIRIAGYKPRDRLTKSTSHKSPN